MMGLGEKINDQKKAFRSNNRPCWPISPIFLEWGSTTQNISYLQIHVSWTVNSYCNVYFLLVDTCIVLCAVISTTREIQKHQTKLNL